MSISLLLDEPPKQLYINGRNYDIRWGFRAGILYEMLMEDEYVERAEKPLLALKLFYPVTPDDISEAVEGMQWFYNCGREERPFKGKGGGRAERIYSFQFDSEYIYAAFREQYAIDLTKEKTLHWWSFRALFNSLRADTAFGRIMGYRGMEIKESMGQEEKAFYRRMKAQYALPVGKREKERMEKLEKRLLEDGDLRGML